MSSITDALQDRIRGRVRGELAHRRRWLTPSRESLVDAMTAAGRAERSLARLDDQLRQAQTLLASLGSGAAGVGPDTTIEVAWTSHPRAPEVFARHHLPACDGCSVRHDETLAEAAEACSLDLDRFLDEIHSL